METRRSSFEYEDLLAKASADHPFEDFDENAVATTFYTSGTTGNPKGVCFTHRQLVLHTLAKRHDVPPWCYPTANKGSAVSS